MLCFPLPYAVALVFVDADALACQQIVLEMESKGLVTIVGDSKALQNMGEFDDGGVLHAYRDQNVLMHTASAGESILGITLNATGWVNLPFSSYACQCYAMLSCTIHLALLPDPTARDLTWGLSAGM